MQKLINKNLYVLIVISFFICGCKSTQNNNHEKYSAYLNDSKELLPDDYLEKLKESAGNINMDSIRSNTTDFYDIEIVSKPNKLVFNLAEQKLFSMKITNYGTKELNLPQWFRNNTDFNNVEMTFVIYKKEKQKFVKYVQKIVKTDIFRHPTVNLTKRVVYETNKGKHITYENIWFDIYQKIVDEGSYITKVYIDLSNFGYFKILETEFLFDVKN
ncbi:MAG: hypothetical protein LCH35_13370 [Bacteroidetes bacterium]|uniref:hypothetical protein n=1 Tax=Flavobacterium sp. TaxID=239 RepID=UPI002FD90368|nr:hypothetical protein [Bacteroidota bacterium]